MNTYSEYFDIDEGYYPEINPSSIKNAANRWDKTFPHKTVIELLKTMERMLARGTNADKKGIWIEGAYGTGKSRVAWMMRNLLDCSAAELMSYFGDYDVLRKETDLRDKLLGHKEGKIITVYRYASGDIDSTRKLIMAVYDSVAAALKAAGVVYKGENTLRGKVADWLEDEIHKAMFNATLEKPLYRGRGSFAGKSADDIIAQLRNPKTNADALLNDIVALGENEGITAFSINMDELTQWLADVIEQNRLKAIVFVWDEFSSFFKNNKNSLDEFQKLAELSSDKPFYLMIVTHMSGSIASEGDQSFNIVRDRFVRKEITMPDSIAFELIRYALDVKDAAKPQWESWADYLNGLMPMSRKAVAAAVHVDENVLMHILPIHPMAALLLKNISTAFASNQRSMFNFIKNEAEDLHAFQWFIENYSPDNGDILTIDYLWEFFYEKGTDEHGNSVGRGNLDAVISTILDTYTLNEAGLNEEQRIVLKTILMMQAISQKFGDSLDLFQPNRKNLNLAFEGTKFDNNYGYSIAKNQLVKKGILFEKPGDVPTFAAAAVSGDQAAIDQIKSRLRSETRTAMLIAGNKGKFETLLMLTPSQKFRYAVALATHDNFTATINRITNEKENYHINAVICFARTEGEQNKLRALLRDAVAEPRYHRLVFIDASASLMGVDRFEQWVDASANEEYWRPKDTYLADDMKRKADEKLAEWKKDIAEGDFVIYPAVRNETDIRAAIACPKMSKLIDELSNVTLTLYPLSFDNAKVSENFFNANQLAMGAKNGIMQTWGGIYQQNTVALMLKGIWQVPGNYWEVQPNQPISRLKIEVERYISDAFEKDVRIPIGDIFSMLENLGFMPCNLYSFLTGFLLKEYVSEQYRYGVGISGDEGGKMTVEKLSDYIGEYIKHVNSPIKNYREKYIEIMTQNQKRFLQFAQEIFSIEENLSVEQAVNKMRYRLKELGYPIWCYKKIDTAELGIFIDKLGLIANSPKESISSLADTFGGMLAQVPDAMANFKSLLTLQNGETALCGFLKDFEGGAIYDLAKKIRIQNISGDVRKQIGSGDALWLWDQETGEEEVRKLIIDYRIIAASIDLGQSCTSMYSCIEAWRSAAKFIQIPASVLTKRLSPLKKFIGFLREIAENGELSYEKREDFLAELEGKTSAITEMLDEKQKIFSEEYAHKLTGFSVQEISGIYSKLPTTSFTDSVPDYLKNLDALVKEAKKEQYKFMLHQEWEKKTASKDPWDWSEKHRTPILAMVSADELMDAKKLFYTVRNKNPEESDVKSALQYLQSGASFVKDLQCDEKVERAFRTTILGKSAILLKDNDEVRRTLEATIPEEIFEWYSSPAVQNQVEKMARDHYFSEGCEKAVRRFLDMPEDKAKEYLIRLIKENPTVGIEIISEEED